MRRHRCERSGGIGRVRQRDPGLHSSARPCATTCADREGPQCGHRTDHAWCQLMHWSAYVESFAFGVTRHRARPSQLRALPRPSQITLNFAHAPETPRAKGRAFAVAGRSRPHPRADDSSPHDRTIHLSTDPARRPSLAPPKRGEVPRVSALPNRASQIIEAVNAQRVEMFCTPLSCAAEIAWVNA